MLPFVFIAQVTLIGAGVVLLALVGRGWRRIPWNMRFHTLFRRTILGLLPLGVGAGWLLGWPALTASALIVGFGELFECTLDISALDEDRRLNGTPRH
jgi:hypothetical protein